MGTPIYKISATAAAYALPKSGSDSKISAGYIPDLSGTYALASHTHAASAITSGTFDAARIPDLSSLYAAAAHNHAASAITSGQIALARGGTNADLSATGGATSFLRQASAGAAVTVGAIVSADLTSALKTPPAIGGTTPAAGAFTTLSASGDTTGSRFIASATLNTGIHIGHSGAPNTGIRFINTARLGIYSGGKLTFYSDNGTDVRMYASDALVLRADPNQNVSIGSTTTTAPPTKLWLLTTDAVTNTITNGLTISHYSSGTPAAGFGAGMVFTLESTTTEGRTAGYVRSLWNTATDAGAIADLVLVSAYNAAGTVTEREGLRIRGGASATQIGFFGTTPAARQTGYTSFANLTTDRTLDANATTLDEVADVLGTLIEDLKTLGLIAA